MTCTVLYIVTSTSSTSWYLNMLVQNFPLGFRAICKTYKKTIEHDSFCFQNQFCTQRHSSHVVGGILVPCANRLYGPVLALWMYHTPYASTILRAPAFFSPDSQHSSK